MRHTFKTIACAMLATISLNAQAGVVSLGLDSGNWKALAPPGSVPNNSYPSPSPIGGVGLAWEAANSGWNSSASYNASAWGTFAGGWINGTGVTPFYARNVFNIAGTATSGTFTLLVDDDSQVWVNGSLIPGLDDHNMGTGGNVNGTNTANITAFLHSGDNVIAFKAHNSAGGGFGVYALSGSVNFEPAPVQMPEPATMSLLGLGLAGLLGMRRRKA